MNFPGWLLWPLQNHCMSPKVLSCSGITLHSLSVTLAAQRNDRVCQGSPQDTLMVDVPLPGGAALLPVCSCCSRTELSIILLHSPGAWAGIWFRTGGKRRSKLENYGMYGHFNPKCPIFMSLLNTCNYPVQVYEQSLDQAIQIRIFKAAAPWMFILFLFWHRTGTTWFGDHCQVFSRKFSLFQMVHTGIYRWGFVFNHWYLGETQSSRGVINVESWVSRAVAL